MEEFTGPQIGHYRLVRELGTGGFADVYLAEHIHLNRFAALKLLRANVASGDVQSFRDEARTIAQLEHPHIVRILDFGIENNVPYLVMDYAPNGTLRQRHPRGTRVPLSLVVMYVKQLASALQYAHTRKLIHRDVKPENVLLGRDDTLLLGDFGAALLTRTSLLLRTQDIIGTAAYMAPEQLRGRPVAASDQYALGVVVYEWLSGICPFEGTLPQVQYLKLYEPAPSLRMRLPNISLAVEQVVMRAMAKHPEQRFATIEAFAEALEQATQQASPLVLSGDVDNQNASQLSPTMFIPPAPLPATEVHNTRIVAKPRYSRRALLGFSVALAVVGSGGGLALLLGRDKFSSVTKPTVPPTPPPTSIKNRALTVYTGHQDAVFSAAWSPDGTLIASAGGATTEAREGDTSIRVWTAKGGRYMSIHRGHTNVVRMVAWSPENGTYIASASEDGTVKVWEAINDGDPFIYKEHTDEVMALAWSPDGKYIASAGLDWKVYVWYATDGTLQAFYDSSTTHVPGDISILPTASPTESTLAPSTSKVGSVTPVAWSLVGNMIASIGRDKRTLNVWDAFSGRTIYTFSFPTSAGVIGTLAWSPDSNSIVTGHYDDVHNVRIWDIKTGDITSILPDDSGNQVYSVAWSPNGKYIAAGDNESQVKVWDYTAQRQVLTYKGHTKPVMSVQWSPDGQYIASCGFDGTVQIWTPFA